MITDKTKLTPALYNDYLKSFIYDLPDDLVDLLKNQFMLSEE